MSNRFAIGLSIVAIVLSVMPWIVFHWDKSLESSFVRIVDGDTGEFVGFIDGRYGSLRFVRVGGRDRRRIELTLQDSGVTIDLHRGDHLVARWRLSDDGEEFQKVAE